MIGASTLGSDLQAFQAEVHAQVGRLVTPGLLFALDRNEIPSRQTVLLPSRPKYVPSERSDGPERP